jgi:8-oxo-dGTP pyrophosphatase MutT (NUDIX family)
LTADPTPARRRVVAYVTREREGALELLVFDHRDFPEAGTQVPAGGIEPGESAGDAVVREVAEETGLDGVRVRRKLGVSILVEPSGLSHEQHFFHAEVAGESDDAWEHEVSGVGEDTGLVFSCRFAPIEDARVHELQRDFLHLVG